MLLIHLDSDRKMVMCRDKKKKDLERDSEEIHAFGYDLMVRMHI